MLIKTKVDFAESLSFFVLSASFDNIYSMSISYVEDTTTLLSSPDTLQLNI